MSPHTPAQDALKKTLRGAGVALATPFDDKNQIDFPALKEMLDFVGASGIDYLVLIGTTGESATLDIEEKKEIIRFCNEHNTHKLPTVIGIGGNNTASIEKAFAALPLEEACAIMSVSPYYNRPSQEGIFQHYKYLSSVAPKPLILYNVPGRTGRNIECDTIVRLARECPNIRGVKEASDDMKQALRLLKECPKDFLLLSGEDTLFLPLLLCGMDGIISVAANVFPKEIKSIADAALCGEVEKAKEIFFTIQSGIDLLFKENNPAGLKAFLSEMGLMKNILRLPLSPLSNPVHGEIKAFLKAYTRI